MVKMGIAANVISVVLKSVVGDSAGNGMIKELADLSIDTLSEKGIDKMNAIINEEKSQIEHILSKENMRSMNISEENMEYVVSEIKELFTKIDISDEVLGQCKFDSTKLKDFLWNEYCKGKDGYIECEREIKDCLFAVASMLIALTYKSAEFDKKLLLQIKGSVDDINAELQKISDYMQKYTIKPGGSKEDKGYKNDKKQEYIQNWNSRLFLHHDDTVNPITLADAFIMPDYSYSVKLGRIKIPENDPLDKVIESVLNDSKSLNVLITGVAGMGKSSITSWIANEYRDNDNVIILRFRDWEYDEMTAGLLKAVCSTLGCRKHDLEDKILILDGFDEMKAADIGECLLTNFFEDVLDFKNFKFVITSRPNYLDSHGFQNVIELLPFNSTKIKQFYRIIKGNELDQNIIFYDNLDVLGIPVILYMAIMSNINITQEATKPELYNRIFAEKEGIFDRFRTEGVGYDNGMQPLRKKGNIKKYLSFLRESAFDMFESDNLVLKKEEYQIPQLEFEEKLISVLEFPVKHLYENTEDDIEFIHKSIYEYFVAEYIFTAMLEGVNRSVDQFACILGNVLKRNILSFEILEFLKYKIMKSRLMGRFDTVKDTFQLMLHDGMTYYSNKRYKGVIKCEMCVFANMLEIIHLWGVEYISFDKLIHDYIKYNIEYELNLSHMDLEDSNLRSAYLYKANLEEANLRDSNLNNVNLRGAKLARANLRNANLRNADLKNADLSMANLREADLRGANLRDTDLRDTNLKDALIHEKQVVHLKEKCNLQYTKICMNETEMIVSYKEYSNLKKEL